ncbi:MAG TPA: hypothetical protein VFY29_02075 [Terriglobia bacterium]|nr:hypothetical protein [Terriglobia bacterium]
MKRLLAVFMALAVGAGAYAQNPAHTTAEPQSYKAGKTDLAIATPVTDMVEVGYDVRERMELFVPATNRLLAAFVPARDMALLADGQPPAGLKRYAMAQIPRQSEYVDIESREFAALVETVKAQFTGPQASDAFQSARQELNRRLKSMDVETPAPVAEPGQLAPFFSKEDAYGFGMVSAVSIGDKTTDVAMGGAVVRLKKKVVFLYLYTEYRQEETMTWLRRATEQWTNALLALNK